MTYNSKMGIKKRIKLFKKPSKPASTGARAKTQKQLNALKKAQAASARARKMKRR